MNKIFDAVIIANGQFPTHEVPLQVLRQASYVVCCDGAIRHYPLADVIVGDGDSVPEEYRDLLIQINEQDDNDLTKATRHCINLLKPSTSNLKSPTSNLQPSTSNLKIAYLGATGLREDHTLGNIGLLMRYYREMGVEGMMFTDYGVFQPAFGDKTFRSKKGQQVSIFNFGCTHLESEGLRWNSYAYDQWWQGTLNEAIGNSFSFRADGYYMVYQTYDVK